MPVAPRGWVRRLALPAALCGCQGTHVSAPDLLGTDTETGDAGSATSGGPGTSGVTTASSTTDPSTSGTTADPPPPGEPGGVDCPGLACLPCGNGMGCAGAGPFIEDTCCAEGDALVHRGFPKGAEVVDVETDGRLLWACGGFGVTISDVTDPDVPETVSGAASRCQRMAIGPLLPSGARRFYLAHHGDTWVPQPFLATWEVDDDGTTLEVDRIEDPDILFEGIRWRAGTNGDPDVLYAAAHSGGVRVYTTNTAGVPSFVSTLGGLDNATKLALAPGHLYIADGEGGVKVASLADPVSPTLVASLDVPGLARDVDVGGDTLAVSLGGDGVDVFDVSDPSNPSLAGHIDVDGSVQGVEIENDIIAVAAWSHAAVYDRSSLQLLATEQTLISGDFEQDLGVAAFQNFVHIGEWEGVHTLEYRPGHVAPDIAITAESIAFDGEEEDSEVVVVRNRGYLDLWVSNIFVESDGLSTAFEVDSTNLLVPPGEGRAFEVSFTPPAPVGGHGRLVLENNDPDANESPYTVPLIAAATERIDVGDRLNEKFAWLDPNGLNQLSGLEGNVVVLAYFALF